MLSVEELIKEALSLPNLPNLHFCFIPPLSAFWYCR